MGNLTNLRKYIFETDNKACFIERDEILGRLEAEMADYDKPDKYAIVFSRLLREVSVPINKDDYFAGRVVEALPYEGLKAPNHLLNSVGHMSPDYRKVLQCGLKGIVSEIKSIAENKGDAESKSFAENAVTVAEAVRDYCLRYSDEAEKNGLFEAAKALRTVPYEPAYDFYSALQGIWILHMILSCYVGSRDYAFGNFDQYMLPFYEKALADGKTETELTELLAGFFVKTNEICGRCTHNYNTKPILCQSSKQYVNIGGECPNKFSVVCLKAAEINNLAQPEIVVRLKADADEKFTEQVFESLEVLTDKVNLYNYDIVYKYLTNKGVKPEIAKDFTYSACCTFDLHYHNPRGEYYVPTVQIFLDVLHSKNYASTEEILKDYTSALSENMKGRHRIKSINDMRQTAVLDSLLLTDTAMECKYAYDKDRAYCLNNLFLSGIATIGDSLMVLDKLVFKERRYSYSEFIKILDEDYENNEELRCEILNYERFGNDSENDNYAVMAGNAMIDAVDELEKRDNEYNIPSFYSLERDNSWRKNVGASPDGRKSGTPFSENQSPTYGADKSGITALLKSVSKLPFDRTAGGGLNLTFSQKISSDILKALVLSYFNMGGLHVGISVINRSDLQDAMIDPDKYKSLTVRLYGFSEYFVSLPEWQQIAVLNRTEYKQ
jgi:formate C-acetyltransferase